MASTVQTDNNNRHAQASGPDVGGGSDPVDAAAARLKAAHSSASPCPPVRDVLGAVDVASAYRVQRDVVTHLRRDGSPVVGRKIGMTSPAVQHQLGVDQPDFGVLLETMRRLEGIGISVHGLIQPKIEAEIAFTLAQDLDHEVLTVDDILDATAFVSPALEIVDSRIQNWDITIVDTIADNGSAALFVLGEAQVEPRALDLAGISMELRRQGEVVSTGTGAECLGNPVNAVLWLARKAREVGDPLRAGSVILSGALGPMVPIAAGDEFHALMGGLGAVSAAFVQSV